MSDRVKDGGPAYPVNELDQYSGGVCAQYMGISVRDYFAAKAMQGICAHADSWGRDIPGIADAAYEMADAMIAEREVTK